MCRAGLFAAAVALLLCLGGSVLAAPPSLPVTIQNPWIVNDRVADCRSVATMGATFKNAYTASGVVAPADDQAIAINCYDNHKRRYYHWGCLPPGGGATGYDVPLSDPVYALNIFGWGLCFNHGRQGATIVKAAGLDGRTIDLISGGVSQHTIYEAYYWNKWHLLDTMTTMYVYDRNTPRQIASCADIAADATLQTAAVSQGRACPGFLLCGDSATWFADAIKNHWEVTPGGIITDNWSMNMDLHTGETFKRTCEAWQNQHPPPDRNADSMPGLDPPYHHECQNDYKDTVNYPYWEPYGQIISYIHTTKKTFRRWANGTYALTPDFRTKTYQDMVYSSSGVATYADDGLTPDLHPAAVGVTGEMVFKIKTPFYFTDATISGDFVRTNAGDVTQLQVSTNGTTWATVWTGTTLGTTTLSNLNIRAQMFGTWGYYLKVILMSSAGSKAAAGVSNLVISTTFEHNKGAMAYLDKGVNNITVTFDNPQDLAWTYTALKVTYKWKEYSGTDWTVDKSFTTYVTTSPATFTITTSGTKVPRTEYIQMDVVYVGPPGLPPDPVVLTASDTGPTWVDLAWTASGDDGSIGQAADYDLRYSTQPITYANWVNATPVTGLPPPQPAGSTEQFRVTGLVPETPYYFVMVVIDHGGNMSDMSNLLPAATRARIAGDVNEDNTVDVVDLLYFVDSFGLVLGDPGYDARCDFNGDNSVDVVDLLMFVDNFGV
jgi:hypothetical protein